MDKKSLIKQWPILFVILFIPAILIATGVIGGSDSDKQDNTAQMREGAIEESSLNDAATSLKEAIDLANRMSGVTEGTDFAFTPRPIYGRHANFGIVQPVGEVKSVGLVDEMAINFSGATNNEHAEVNSKTNQVIAFHRETDYSGEIMTYTELEQIARQYVERIDPGFSEIESALSFGDNIVEDVQKGSNYFFRWNDTRLAMPEGVEMDIPPYIQVGITYTGFIFSYTNTVQLYRNLPKETLRAICGHVEEIPQTDDVSVNSIENTVQIWFDEYEPVHQSKVLTLPYEPDIDFEGCSEVVKEFFLTRLPNPYE
ncbi:MAG: hypothetical protein WD509_02550 [Candidatus Paceibacterota bacterium]